MRNTKKITMSSILVALGVVILALGAVIELVDLTVCAIASLIVVFIYLEIGSPYTWLTWLCTSLIAFLVFPGSMIWMNYLIVFGVYPILKAYIEKAPRALWLIIKLVYINAVITALFFLVELVFGIPLFEDGRLWFRAILWVLINVAFIAYDMFLTVSVKLYYAKIRQKFIRFLK